jgi:hypothetical protein
MKRVAAVHKVDLPVTVLVGQEPALNCLDPSRAHQRDHCR